MEFFKKRRNALLLMVVVMLLATVFGVHRSLGARVQEVSDLFSDGVYDDDAGYRQKSVRSQLEVRSAASLNLLTVAASYDAAAEDAAALRAARSALVSALDSGKGPGALYDLNAELGLAFTRLETKLGVCGLTSADKSSLETDSGRMVNAARVMEESGYNEAVRGFYRDTLNTFPTSFLKYVCFVDMPECFE